MDLDYDMTNWPPVRVAICQDDSYRTYNSDQNPEALFKKATQYLSSITANHTAASEHKKTLVKWVNDSVIHAIYGSNMIERAGLPWEATFNYCHRVLRGMDLQVDSDSDDDIRGRREVVQHMRAYQHILRRFVTLGEDMSEDLIKETHAILCNGVSIIDPEYPEVPWEKYAGKYRKVPVGAGNTMFTMPKFVPAKMTEMCANLKREIDEGGQSLDPFSLASKYSLRFVEIHPFQDGNGRMCRLILNAILFRYLGIVVPIGETEEDRVEYINIKKRASRDMEGHGEYATFVLRKGVRAIQKLKQKFQGKKS
ncbi:fic doc family [Fusarium sporotrichioides]|uniref:Fic doc family n=1 Tax=Fusarium sporotrichioides TaxID=5514 RepID=A0A395SHF7_FUSSP|nr:fic doc family [Fusarium sporotrichioides]